ncbi:hypothetical protein [Flavobacterium sp. N1736]|uniref:hypothetical protein n=1 Tax=Flavobacterium sp. N1736 TaxID=2986823 RepID=UPI002225818F|nr:hypothetical protein [Flavobacterium sp. N1736]
MRKIINYSILTLIAGSFIFYLSLYFIGGYYVGSYGSGKIRIYQFETKKENLEQALNSICNDSKNISCKDSINYIGRTYKKSLIIKLNDKPVYILKLSGDSVYSDLHLIYINGKKNDDFGWFSIEKYKKVKLFEKEIIEPLSKKYEYEKLE